VISVWVLGGAFLVMLAVALVSFTGKSAPNGWTLLGLVGVLLLVLWWMTGRQLVSVSVKDDRITTSTYFLVPFSSPSVEHAGARITIESQDKYAVFNTSGETLLLSRAGGVWPFNLGSFPAANVKVEPGAVVYIPAAIKPLPSRGVAYFSVMRMRQAEAVGVRLLDEGVPRDAFESAWPEVYVHQQRVVDVLGQKHVRSVVAARLAAESNASFEDVFIAYDPAKARFLWGFNFAGEGSTRAACLEFSPSMEWLETRTSSVSFFAEGGLYMELEGEGSEIIYLYREFSESEQP